MITVQSLSKKYGGFTPVYDVTFSARAGRFTGFLGPNGAGKSTTMRIMVGLTPATSGSAEVSGRRAAPWRCRAAGACRASSCGPADRPRLATG